MAFVPAVPEAVAAGFTLADILVALTAVVAFAVCYGMLFAWNYTFGYLLDALGNVLNIRVRFVHVDLGAPVRALDHGVRSALAAGISTSEHAMGLFFHWAGLMLAWMVNFAMATAEDTLTFARWLTGDHLPKYVKWAVRAAFPLPWLTKVVAQEIAKLVPRVGHIAKAAATGAVTVVYHPVRAFEHELTRLRRQVAALTAAVGAIAGTLPIPHSFPHPGAIWRGLTKRAARLERRMARMEKLLGVAAFAAAMANVLGLPNWRCLTRGNFGRLARHVCGVPRWLIDLLVLGSIEAFVATDLCAFTNLLIAEAEKAKPALMALVDVEDALIDCHGTVKPLLFNLPPADVTPLQGVSPLAA